MYNINLLIFNTPKFGDIASYIINYSVVSHPNHHPT
jgi:hypothetical protein